MTPQENKPDFEALLREIGVGTISKSIVLKLCEHVWSTYVVPLVEWQKKHIRIMNTHGYAGEIERLESENKSLRDEVERLKEKIDHLEYENPEDI